MMRIWVLVLACAAFAVTFRHASANGSPSEFAAGGVVFREAADIAIAREDLYVSLDVVRVSYVYRSDAKETQNITIAFPMPPVPVDPGDLHYLGGLGRTNEADPRNYMKFTVKVDGKPVVAKLHEYAYIDQGYDLGLMSIATANNLVNEGRNLIIVALVGTELHIRIFDASGKRVVDKGENDLIGPYLTDLKERLKRSGLSKEGKEMIIEEATSSAGYTRGQEDVSELVKASGLPLFFPPAGSASDMIEALPADKIRSLSDRGIVSDRVIREGVIHMNYSPLWRYQSVYEWQQSFPPGTTTVEVSYRPLTGDSDDCGSDTPPRRSRSTVSTRAFDPPSPSAGRRARSALLPHSATS